MKITESKSSLILVSAYLKEHGTSLCTIESCTGGNIATRFTSVPGASDYFFGSLVPYSTQIKTDVLQIPPGVILQHGEVSTETAREMLLRGLVLFKAEIGIATTGFAGPTGGNDIYPVGSVIVAAGSKEKYDIKVLRYPGVSRDDVMHQSTDDSIDFLAEQILG